MIARSLLGLLAVFTAVGCVPATWFDRIDTLHMKPRLEYQGFSFDRPPSVHWYLLQSEQSHTLASVRRDTWSLGATHNFYAIVGLWELERQPASHEDFAELARSRGQQAPYEVVTRSYEQVPTTQQNQWCIRFDAEYGVLGAPPAPEEELTMLIRGYRCLHPAWPKTALEFFYSERGLPDQLDPELQREGETFLESVRIDLAPGTPAS